MAGHAELSKDVDIDIPGLFSNIWKKKRLIMILSLVAGAAVFIVMSSVSPRYRANTQLIIEPRESQFTRVDRQNIGVNSNEFDKAAVLSQVQIILSDAIAISTIKKLGLATKPEFSSENQNSLVSDFLILTGFKNDNMNVPPEETGTQGLQETSESPFCQ